MREAERMETLGGRLLEALNGNGYRGRIISLERLRELQAEIERLREDRLIDRAFFESTYAWLEYNAVGRLPDARSVIIAAMPQRTFNLSFLWKGETRLVTLPPTYAFYDADQRAQALIEEVLRPEGRTVAMIQPPLKLLAVRSGLSLYGRNNLTYVDGMGSFNRLVAWVSDLEAEADSWQEARRMPECDHCRRCLDACPTGCILSERRLVNAKTCLTNLNESDTPFPSWVDGSWHNALVGCMACQSVCPKNKPFLQPETWPDSFDEDETALLLSEPAVEGLPRKTWESLRNLSMLGYYKAGVIQRNLKILLERA